MDAYSGASFHACPPRRANAGTAEEVQDFDLNAGRSREAGADPFVQASGATSYGTLPPYKSALAGEIRMLVQGKADKNFAVEGSGDQEILFQQLRRHWPHYYTLACLALFSAPVTAALHLARDASVHFWVGNIGFCAFAIPWLLALVHVFNVKVREARMIPVICSTVIPAIILGVIANVHMHWSGQISHRLISKDCTTWQTKRNIQKSWVVAAGLYERCVNRTTAEHQLKFSDGLQFLRLQDCSEFDVQAPDIWAAHRPAWAYLRRMEEDHECSGWCFHSAPLWSFQATKDACAITAGNVMTNRVDIVSQRMLAYALVVGIISILSIMQYGHELRKRGVEWSLA